MADHHDTEAPKWGASATGPGFALNDAALREAQALRREFARWYDRLAAERYGGLQATTRRRTP